MRTALLVALCLAAYGLPARADDAEEEPAAEEAAPAPKPDAIDAAGTRGPAAAGVTTDRGARPKFNGSRPASGRGGGGGGGGAGAREITKEWAEDAGAEAVGKPLITTMQAAKAEAMSRRNFNHANPVFATGVVYAYAFKTPAAQATKVPAGEFHWSPVPSRNVCERLSASISANAGDLKGVCRATQMGVYGDLRWTYGGKGCSLAPEKIYFFNLKCEKCVEGTGAGYQNQVEAYDCENIAIDDLLNWVAKPK